MNVQQAPSPPHAALVAPAMLASVIAQRRKGGMVSARNARTTKVRRVLPSELKRLRRSQSIGRGVVPPGPCSIASPASPPGGRPGDGRLPVMTVLPIATERIREPARWDEDVEPASSPLHQGDALVVPIHERRGEQVDRQEDGHDDDDRLDLPARLV